MSTSLQSIADKYSYLKLASQEDNEKILDFFRKIAMSTSHFSINYERSPNFFNLLEHQAETSYVGIFKNEDHSIGGLASFCLRRSYVNSKPTYAAYLSDLRLSPRMSRKTRLEWRNFYRDLLAHSHLIPEFKNCEFFYSAILDKNKSAIQAFTRDKSDIVYRELYKYQTISILGKFPSFFSHKETNLIIKSADENDFKKLKKFLHSQNLEKPFGHFFNENEPDELERRLDKWEGLKLSNFILVENLNNEIIACVCPWSSRTVRRLVIEKMPFYTRLLGLIPLVFGKKPILPHKEIHVLCLTHLEISFKLSHKERVEILELLLNEVFKRKLHRNYHIVSFFDFPHQCLTKSLFKKGYVYQKTPATLYQVLHRKHLEQNKINPIHELTPGFEIGIA